MPSSRGFNLLELVIVVAIIGLITIVAMPNLIEALDRSRRTSTMADMRSIATALERYAVDYLTYPASTELAELKPAFVPDYIKSLPVRDGWGHPLEYEVTERGASYTLRSPGKDGVFATTPQPEGFDVDLLMVDGAFIDPAPTETETGPAT